ncbi:MAG: triose-phosphate isomerase [Rubricoccaceae bacterium]|nr:triose-phosphate isomerase [Rubricoccaceae bacterium]
MLVAGNWKMNTDLKSATRLASEVVRQTEVDSRTVQVTLCPPTVWLESVRECIRGSRVTLGAQNVHPADSGAFTGEVAAPMLSEIGCRFVIAGHSERRQYFAETDAFIGEKVRQVQKHGMVPILCVGESLTERESGHAETIVQRQLDGGLAGVRLESPENLVIAYEPVWAIGTGRTATPVQAQEIHAFIRRDLHARFGNTGNEISILYGGSVKPDNAGELFSQPDIDGGLIGGASLSAESFASIVHSAAQSQ